MDVFEKDRCKLSPLQKLMEVVQEYISLIHQLSWQTVKKENANENLKYVFKF